MVVELAYPSGLPPLFNRTSLAFPDLTYYNADIPISLGYVARYGRHQRIPLEKLIVRQTLSQPVIEYMVPFPAAVATRQLEEVGKFLRPGQNVRFIYTLGVPGVHSWDLEQTLDPKMIDVNIYKKLLDRAMETVLQVFTST